MQHCRWQGIQKQLKIEFEKRVKSGEISNPIVVVVQKTVTVEVKKEEKKSKSEIVIEKLQDIMKRIPSWKSLITERQVQYIEALIKEGTTQKAAISLKVAQSTLHSSIFGSHGGSAMNKFKKHLRGY